MMEAGDSSLLRPSGGPPVAPQMARRVAILGAIALALFAVIFLRLWFLQVLTGDQSRREALDNRVRSLPVSAPRGSILDRNGTPIVENRVATVLTLDPKQLPAKSREDANAWGQAMTAWLEKPRKGRGAAPPVPPPATPEVAERYRRLGSVLGISAAAVNERVVPQLAQLPYANVKVKVDVPSSVRNYLLERQSEFPGVSVDQAYIRRYPGGVGAAQVVGAVGEVSPEQVGSDEFRGVLAGGIVGQEGIERSYDRYLRGTDGTRSVTVDAAGRLKGQRVSREARPGNSLRTTIDAGLQRRGEQALAGAIGGAGTAGAFVALDPRDGKVLAIGSAPTFDPAERARPIATQAEYERRFGEAAGAPLFNRAIGGSYPVGSVFKPVTALAALDAGLATPDTPVNDPGFLKVGEQTFTNAGRQANGTVSLRRALQVSSDVYFYTLGRDANPVEGQVIQSWARKLGFDRPTGIDLPGEAPGTIPDRAWRARQNQRQIDWEKKNGKSCPPDCLYSDKRLWSVGDNIQLSVGQGDVQASPLQVAVAYAALANGGSVVRPHLGAAVETVTGRQVEAIETPPARKLKMDPVARQAILDGLHLATVEDGTSADVFSDWNQDRFKLYGKTGTAERPPRPDQSWYAAFVDDPARPIVVVATVEDGGFGAESAAPVACSMLAGWYRQSASCAPGGSRTR
jgi:penicillin-binding protein 2